MLGFLSDTFIIHVCVQWKHAVMECVYQKCPHVRVLLVLLRLIDLINEMCKNGKGVSGKENKLTINISFID